MLRNRLHDALHSVCRWYLRSARETSRDNRPKFFSRRTVSVKLLENVVLTSPSIAALGSKSMGMAADKEDRTFSYSGRTA
jgi:hypothetical protein